MRRISLLIITVCVTLLTVSTTVYAEDDIQKQINDIKGALPKFAIPMREVGERFQNMYYAAKGGNWALAAYMEKYMNAAMNPARVTKPEEYEAWKSFYTDTFVPLNNAMQAHDWKAFEKVYDVVIQRCNDCHAGMGYGFIKVVKMKRPADEDMNYELKSKASDVPK